MNKTILFVSLILIATVWNEFAKADSLSLGSTLAFTRSIVLNAGATPKDIAGAIIINGEAIKYEQQPGGNQQVRDGFCSLNNSFYGGRGNEEVRIEPNQEFKVIDIKYTILDAKNGIKEVSYYRLQSGSTTLHLECTKGFRRIDGLSIPKTSNDIASIVSIFKDLIRLN